MAAIEAIADRYAGRRVGRAEAGLDRVELRAALAREALRLVRRQAFTSVVSALPPAYFARSGDCGSPALLAAMYACHMFRYAARAS